MTTATTFVGLPGPDTDALAAALGADVVPAPALHTAGGWDWSWRHELRTWATVLARRPPSDRVVLCTWPTAHPASELVELDTEGWMAAVEQPLAQWFTALVALADRCRDGGAVVVVVERPAALDSKGRAATVAVGEGLLTLVRSAALTHGTRGVRINAVVSEIATAPERLLGLPPILPWFPGAPATEIAGAVRMLLSGDAAGVSGTAIRADCGRSW